MAMRSSQLRRAHRSRWSGNSLRYSASERPAKKYRKVLSSSSSSSSHNLNLWIQLMSCFDIGIRVCLGVFDPFWIVDYTSWFVGRRVIACSLIGGFWV